MNGRTFAAAVLIAVTITAAILVSSNTSGWREAEEQRAEKVALTRAVHLARIDVRIEECRTKGGVPITEGWKGMLVRWDFPRRP